MPNREAQFRGRISRPTLDETPYQQQRSSRYPGVGNGFPPPHMTGGYSASAQWNVIKQTQEEADASRRAYFTSEGQSRAYVARQSAEEQRYLEHTAQSITPRDHNNLRTLARGYADAEITHARAREGPFVHVPLAYGTAASQQEHYDHVAEHYRQSDDAEVRYATHSRLASDPNSNVRDLYGREVVRGAKPCDLGYPGTLPPQGHYSTTFGSASASAQYTIKPAKPRGSRKH
ncbi:MAG: hypothetical protein Q9219_001884 [cf. Caloplaca sp. 3 TL-2023]